MIIYQYEKCTKKLMTKNVRLSARLTMSDTRLVSNRLKYQSLFTLLHIHSFFCCCLFAELDISWEQKRAVNLHLSWEHLVILMKEGIDLEPSVVGKNICLLESQYEFTQHTQTTLIDKTEVSKYGSKGQPQIPLL